MKNHPRTVFVLVVVLILSLVSENHAWGVPSVVEGQKSIVPPGRFAPGMVEETLFQDRQQVEGNPAWVIEEVGMSKSFGGMTDRSLALDDAGYPHIAYGGENLYYAWQDSMGWHFDVADSSLYVGEYASLALDSANRPHIGYYEGISHTLRYAYFDGTAWVTETVDGAAYNDISIALDTAGRPHISYYAGPPWEDLRYAYFDGTAWVTQTVDDQHAGLYNSLALDSADRPHIGYYRDYPTNQGDLAYAYFDGATWMTQTVDSGGGLKDVGRYASLALDSTDRPHISYYNTTNADLKYASYDGTAWQIETVDSAGFVGRDSSLGLDGSGFPHIGYVDVANGDLRYAHFDGTAWLTATVDGDGNVGANASLALDAAGRPHVSYYDSSNEALKYARFDGTAWQIETVDSVERFGQYCSLALDSLGRPHISYYDDLHSGLEYAYFDGLAWQIQSVDDALGVGHYTSLALDDADRPHISYDDGRNHDLRYAYFDGLSWQIQIVDSAGDMGTYTSLALDHLDRPHIAYVDYNRAVLKYASFDGSVWYIETVDSGNVGEWDSLRLDSADRPHISYYDQTNKDLKYAYFDGSSWQIERVDSQGYVGKYTSLALDDAGRPHISYYDETYDHPKYAYLSGTVWISETVPDWGGEFTSLALDLSNQPRISYHNSQTLDLRYAYYDGATWRFETVDQVASTFPHSSLALDSSGRPHLAYNDINGNLEYAYRNPIPIQGVEITGPISLPVGTTGLYTATYSPPTATAPITFTWNNGGSGPTSSYSWTVAGAYAVTVTVHNPFGQASDVLTVSVLCEPVEGVTVTGPLDLLPGQEATYYADTIPITASAPMTLTWDNGEIGPAAVYSWTMPGLYTLTVTATNACGEVRGTLAVQVLCQPVAGIAVYGPEELPVGETGLYTATAAPITATLPVTFTWDNGSSGSTAIYSWTMPGSYSVTVTATNACGEVRGALAVQVPCQPVAGIAIYGPEELLVGKTGLYTATAAPITATLPVTFTWDNGNSGSTAIYSWTIPGSYSVTVTATNACGAVSGQLAVEVDPYRIYLPLALRGGSR